ncbi:hypothetical protein [Nocardia sp. NPDC057455]|uniref:hypothetical protein n=1 Tax=Nocardia sp. NPDC057455 TaxID=3346138 RepID=UPI003672B112
MAMASYTDGHRGVDAVRRDPPRSPLMAPPPDRETLDRASDVVDAMMRRRFGDREPSRIELEDLYQENMSLVEQYVHVDKGIERLARQLGRSTDEVRAHMRDELRTLLHDKPVAIRIRADSLISVLDEGRYTSRRTPGGERALAEHEWFGSEPTYGYVAIDGVRPSGLGDDEWAGTDALNEWGREQIVLKPEVRERCTFTVGDSLIHKSYSVPSPLTDPLEWSYGVSTEHTAMSGLDRDYSGQPFRSRCFVEAQIHGDVTVDDIDYVALHKEPSESLQAALERSGVDWRVTNNSTIAEHGSMTERAAALERAETDLNFLRNSSGEQAAEGVHELLQDVHQLRNATGST